MMKKLLLWSSILVYLISVFIAIVSASPFRTKMAQKALGLEHKNNTQENSDRLSKAGIKINNSLMTLSNCSNWTIPFNNSGIYDSKLNSSRKEGNIGCHGDESPAICHTYIHNMYQFYSTIGGFVMLAIVFIGISFLIITHFHGRHIVKTNQHVVGTIAKWDAIQHRKQQSRERNGNWI